MLSNKLIYLAYKKAEPTGTWHVIGILSFNNDSEEYSFKYTHGALNESFKPFNGMDDLYQEYRSKELYPLFQNRILYEKRPEYKQFIKWLGLEQGANPIDILALSGGRRITDSLQTFGNVKVNSDKTFSHSFFMHGLSHLDDHQIEKIAQLSQGEKLYLFLDKQNEYDPYAVGIRTSDPKNFIGFCPRYLSKTVSKLMENDANSLRLEVEILNNEAPLEYRLKCKLMGKIPDNKNIAFHIDDEFLPII